MSQLLKIAASHPIYQSIPKTAELKEDLTFTLPKKTLIGEVLASLKKADGLVKSVELKDQYKQNYTFGISYWSPDQNPPRYLHEDL